MIILAMLPFAGLSASEKLALADPAARDPALFRLALLTCLATTLIFILFTAVYLVMTFRLQMQHRAQLMERYSDIEKRSLDWLRIVLLLWGCAWTLYTINNALAFLGWYWAEVGTLLSILEVLTLLAFAHFALNQPALESHDGGAVPVARRVTTLDTKHGKHGGHALLKAPANTEDMHY